ncbi:MAG: hypothetical protein JXA25_20700 [Anaerolineales bacterium]|nr:hypothetical protein [Anaerolineales bacterium]
MKKPFQISILLMVLILLLTACGGGADEISTDPVSDQGADSAEAVPETMDEPLQVEEQAGNTESGFNLEDPDNSTQLAMLIFSLEGGELAVTSEQAVVLLPLWKSIRAQSTAQTADTTSMTAVYEQIAAAMTVEQMERIDDINSDPQVMQDLLASLGIESGMGPGGGVGGRPAGGVPGDNPSDSTRVPGEGDGPGTPPEGEWTEEQQATMQAERPGMGGRGMFGQVQLLLEPLIELLQSRAAG